VKRIISILFLGSLLIAEVPQQSVVALISAFSNISSSDRHLTPHLLEIAKNGHLLEANDKSRLEKIGFNFNSALVSRGGTERSEAIGLDKIYDSGDFRIHYTTNGLKHKVSDIDINNNDVPDYIDNVAEIFNYVSKEIQSKQGYLSPPGDGFYPSGNDNGGSNHYDVYVRNISSRYYGYTQPELYAQDNGDNERSKTVIEKNAFTSYMAIRNNYNNFPMNQEEAIKVTAAHEYFHAIQFGYDGWEKPWLLEATAVWMEEAIYDEINDCYQYMDDWFLKPHRSLDESGFHWYGSFIFFEFLEQHMGGYNAIRTIFDESVQSNSRERDGSHNAIHASMKKQGFSFQRTLNGMSVANKIMSSLTSAGGYAYEEAESYPVTGPAIFKTINFQTGTRDTLSSTNLERFGSQYTQIVTQKPVQVDLINTSGFLSDLQLNAILKKTDNSYLVISNPSINIDPLEIKSIHLSVVSHDTIAGNWDYQLTIQDGKPGTDTNVPQEFTIGNPYPNPFNDNVQFSLYMQKESSVSIDVIDLSGKRSTRLFNGILLTGNHNFSWHGKDNSGNQVSSGIYYIKVSGKYTEKWRPITLVK
jgi:hypothetical protein